jgi:hypothetical protein
MSDLQITGARGSITSAQTSISGSEIAKQVGVNVMVFNPPDIDGIVPGAPVITYNTGDSETVSGVVAAQAVVGVYGNIAGLISSVVEYPQGGSDVGIAAVQSSGFLTLTTEQWNAALQSGENSDGLIENDFYYVSASEQGKLTRTCPVGGTPPGRNRHVVGVNCRACPGR